MASRPAPAAWPRKNRRRYWRRRIARPWSATMPAMLALIPTLPRAKLARLTQHMIDRLDVIDGDPDFELHGDEVDGCGSVEEDWGLAPAYVPPGEGEDDEDGHDREQADN